MMGQFGVAAPLCSYVYITVNGADWGLYLAVEGIEESFLQRNYGSNYGELYKPDSTGFGGERGNGKDFSMEDFMSELNEQGGAAMPQMPEGFDPTQLPEGFDPAQMFENCGGQGDAAPQTEAAPQGNELPAEGVPTGQAEDMPTEQTGEMPIDRAAGQMAGMEKDSGHGGGRNGGAGDGGFGGGMGSSDVKLQYIDDDPDSYSNIFSSAKTDVTDADQARLIQSLKFLSQGESIEDVVNVEEVIRYFVVHNFVVNGDSYTGSMIHNYYLYEENGQLSMLPWDYNLAYGTFQSSNATGTVNTPIDTPVSGGTGEDRPMINWIFSSEEYTQLYHQYFAQFLESTDFAALIDETAELIAPYVEKDPSKFYSYEEFETGVATIREFCLLRAQSVQGQLDGTIPSTTQGQSEDSSALVDASHITISDMGSMGGMGGAPGGMGQKEFTRGDKNAQMAQPGDSTAFPMNTAGGMQPTMPGGEMPSVESVDASSSAAEPETDRTMQKPDRMEGTGNFEGNFPTMDGGSFPGSPEMGNNTQSTSSVLLLTGISLLVLLVGLLVAFKFKR